MLERERERERLKQGKQSQIFLFFKDLMYLHVTV